MKKAILCLVATIATFACSNAQKKEFSETSLSKKLTTVENTQITLFTNLKILLEQINILSLYYNYYIPAMII